MSSRLLVSEPIADSLPSLPTTAIRTTAIADSPPSLPTTALPTTAIAEYPPSLPTSGSPEALATTSMHIARIARADTPVSDGVDTPSERSLTSPPPGGGDEEAEPHALPPTPLMRRACALKASPVTSEEARQIGAIDALFDVLDKNGDGEVTKREVKTAIKAGGPEFAARLGVRRTKDVEELVQAADADGDRKISRYEFHGWMVEKGLGRA